MAQQNATLVINANTQDAENGLRRVGVGMQENRRGALELSSAFNSMNLAIAGSSGALGALRNLLGTLGLGVGIHQLAEYMDSWANLNARLKLVTNSFQEFQASQKGVFDIAQSTRQGLKETADLYYKVADATKAMGKSQQDVLQHVKAVNQAMIISGSSPESAKAAITQYIQSIQGVMQGDEARSLREQAPRLFRAIRENIEVETGKFGASQMKFKQLLSDGFVDTNKLFGAMERAAPQLEKEFSKLPLTIGQAWQLLENQMLKFVGSQSESTGMFTAIANGVKLLSENIDNLVNVLGIAVASWAAYKAMVFLNIEGMIAAGKENEIRLAGIAAETAAIETNTAANLANAQSNMAKSSLHGASYLSSNKGDIPSINATAVKTANDLATATNGVAFANARLVSSEDARILASQNLAVATSERVILERSMAVAQSMNIIAQNRLNEVVAIASGLNTQDSRALFIHTNAIENARIAQVQLTSLKANYAVAVERETALHLIETNAVRAEIAAKNNLTATNAILTESKVTNTAAISAKKGAMTARMALMDVQNKAAIELAAATTAHTLATQANTVAQAEAAFAASYTGKAFGFLKSIVIGVKDEVLILTAAMMRNPFVAAAVAITAAATASYAYRDSLIKVGEQDVTLWSSIKANWNAFTGIFEWATTPISNFFDDFKKAIEGVMVVARFLKELFVALIPDSVVSKIDWVSNKVSALMPDWKKIGNDAKAMDKADKQAAEYAKFQDKNEAGFYSTPLTDKVSAGEEMMRGLNTVKAHQDKIKKLNDDAIIDLKKQTDFIADLTKKSNAELDAIKKQDFESQIAQANKESAKYLEIKEVNIKKENEAIAQLNKKDSGNTVLEKEIAAKRANMKEYQSLMIEELAMKHGVPANLVKATATTESSWNPNAISPVGARGLLQVMPANFKHLGIAPEDVQNEKVMTDKSITFLKEIWIAAGKDIDKFWVLWNQGHLNKDKETGAFSMSLQAEETQKGLPKLKEAYKQDGGELSALTDLERAHTKALTEHEQAAKKLADNDRQLTESTAFGKYNATIDELTEANKRFIDTQGKSGISQATYSQGIENANETLFKNTDYVQENIKILDQQAKEYAKVVGHVQDYNAIIEESQANLARKAISPQQHSVNVAQANASLLNQVTDKQIPVAKVGEVIDAQSALKATEEMAKFKDEMDKATVAFDSFGNSGKMAFDGILGGISAVASAATSFADEMAKLNNHQDEAAKKYEAAMNVVGATEQQKADATKQFAKEKEVYDSKAFATEISGARSLAGAASKMFSEKSAARKAFHSIEIGLAVVEMAMSAKKMIVDVAAGAANMFAQGGFAGFAGVAAMATVMGGLGFAMSGGSKPVVDNTAPATKAEGTILGSPTETSNSLDNIIKTLNNIHDIEYPELKAIGDSFRGVDRSMYELRQNMARSTANFSNMQGMGIPTAPTGQGQSKNPLGSGTAIAGSLIGSVALGATNAVAVAGLGAGVALASAGATALGTGMVTAAAGAIGTATAVGGSVGMAAGSAAATMVGGASLGLGAGLVFAALQYGLGKLLGIGKVKYQQIGEGIVIGSGKLIQDGMTTALDAQTWRKDLQTIKGWFSDKKTVIETYGQLSDDIYNSLQGVSNNLTLGMIGIAKQLNIWDAIGYKLTDIESRPMLKMDFFKDGKRVDDTGKAMSDQINAWMDRIATNVFGMLFEQYQKLGEGMMETVVRLSTQVAAVKGAYKKMGLDVGETNLGMVHFADTMVQFYQSSAKADDGLKNFMSAMDAVYQYSTTKGQKSQLNVTQGKGALAFLGLGNIDIFDVDATKKAIADLEKMSIDNLNKQTAETEKLRLLQPAVTDFNNPMPATTMNDLFKIIGGNRGDWEAVWGKDLNKATMESSAWSREYLVGLGEKWKPVLNFFDEKSAIKSTAASKGGDTIAPDVLAAQIAASNKILEGLATESVNLATATGYFSSVEKDVNKIIALQDIYYKNTLSQNNNLERERVRILKDEYVGFTESFEKNPLFKDVIDAMKKAGITSDFSAKSIQKFIWSIEDTAKSTLAASKAMKEANDYVKVSFSQSITDWVNNLKSKVLGSTKSQLDSAKLQFETANLRINNVALSAEEKRIDLSKITGLADTYIGAIKAFYGANKEGADLTAQVVASVEKLPESLDVANLQLNVLDAIRTNTANLNGFTPAIQSILQSYQAQYKSVSENTNLSVGIAQALKDALDRTALTAIGSVNKSPEISAQIASTAGSAIDAISKLATATLPDNAKIASLNALNNGLISWGTALANYEVAPLIEKVSGMKVITESFTSLISAAVTNIGDKNFGYVFTSVMGAFNDAAAVAPTDFSALTNFITGAKSAMALWDVGVAQGVSNSGASAAVNYAVNVKTIALDYTLDETTKTAMLVSVNNTMTTALSILSTSIDFKGVTIPDSVKTAVTTSATDALLKGLAALVPANFAITGGLTPETKASILASVDTAILETLSGFTPAQLGTTGDLVSTTTAKILAVTDKSIYATLDNLKATDLGTTGKFTTDTLSKIKETAESNVKASLDALGTHTFKASDFKPKQGDIKQTSIFDDILISAIASQHAVISKIGEFAPTLKDVKPIIDDMLNTGAKGMYSSVATLLGNSATNGIDIKDLSKTVTELNKGTLGFYKTASGIVASTDLTGGVMANSIGYVKNGLDWYFYNAGTVLSSEKLTAETLKTGIGSLTAGANVFLQSVDDVIGTFVKLEETADLNAKANALIADANNLGIGTFTLTDFKTLATNANDLITKAKGDGIALDSLMVVESIAANANALFQKAKDNGIASNTFVVTTSLSTDVNGLITSGKGNIGIYASPLAEGVTLGTLGGGVVGTVGTAFTSANADIIAKDYKSSLTTATDTFFAAIMAGTKVDVAGSALNASNKAAGDAAIADMPKAELKDYNANAQWQKISDSQFSMNAAFAKGGLDLSKFIHTAEGVTASAKINSGANQVMLNLTGNAAKFSDTTSSIPSDAFKLRFSPENQSIHFATGGAFTNGIVDRPTSFNMGLMGEAGSEGILPLKNINGSLGVNAILPKQAANDSNKETADEIKQLRTELKAALAELNKFVKAGNEIAQDGFTQTVKETKKTTKAVNDATNTGLKQGLN
ncbi:MAG: tape measure protein [Methylococcales bacterium]|nr:tape measure protein [Methylococcales bacterium]